MYIGLHNKSNISDIIPQQAPTNAELLEYTTLQDENAEVTPLVEPPEHGSLQWSQLTKNAEHSYARTQSVNVGVQQFEQEQQRGSSNLLRQHEDFHSLDLDIEKRFTSSLHHWDDTSNLAQLKDESAINDSKVASDKSSSSNYSTSKKPKNTVPYRESVVSASSLESFTLDEHGNLNHQYSDYDKMKSTSSSNRSSCVDIDDIVIITDPAMFTITEG